MRRRIYNPNSQATYFDVPIIASIPFLSMQDRAQERILFHDNSSASSRVIHVKRVQNFYDASQYVDVERVDEFFVKDMQSQAQEIRFYMSNRDPPPIQLDGTRFPAHQAVHYVRFFMDNNENSNVYGDMELIDEARIRDTVSQAQEWIYFLRWPDLGTVINDPQVPYVVTTGYCDPSLPLAPS